MATRIKGLRKKQSNGAFGEFKPFGTDGTLVDMLSGLDNEQELKLGGNHSASIVESVVNTENVTTITERYLDKTNTTIQYSVVTNITSHSNGSTTIVSTLYSGSDLTTTPLNVKTTTIPANGAVDFTIGEVLSE